MELEWDEEKDRINRAKHGISLAEAVELDWEGGKRVADERKDYGEHRELIYANLGERLFVCIFARRDKFTRIISLRKANKREIMKYGQGIQHPDLE